jgi:ribosomal protein S18 acetylase RimI-like enzyme
MVAEPHYFNIVLGPPASLCEALRAGEANLPMPLEGDVDLTIRQAQPGDVAVLAQLVCELGYETTKSEMQMRMERIATDERYRTFVAMRDGKVCGMIGTFAYYSFVHNDPCGRIVALVVRKDSRRLAVGRRLVTAVEKDFVRRGIKRIALDTRLTREDAHKFYESLGYERTRWRFVKQLPTSN